MGDVFDTDDSLEKEFTVIRDDLKQALMLIREAKQVSHELGFTLINSKDISIMDALHQELLSLEDDLGWKQSSWCTDPD